MARDVAQLGSFEIDLQAHALFRSGRRIHLPAQSARLLALLARRAPEIVSREEIRIEIWGRDTHVEFDAAVNACISQIRSALGDSARAPRFIETVPRRGYRCLVTPVTGAVDESDTITTIAAIPATTVAAISRVWTALAFSLAVVVSVLVWNASANATITVTPSLVAMQKYERGISGLADASPSELLARVRYFETAIAAEPNFARAYAGLAHAKLLIGAYRVEPAVLAYASAKAAAQRALSLDPDLADAHAAFGAAALYFEWDWSLARGHLRRAVAQDPRSASVQLWWSRFLTAAGEHAAATAAARHAVLLAPGSPSALTQLGIANYYAGRREDSAAACAEARALMREFVPAVACIEAAMAREISSPNMLLVAAVDLVRTGDRERAIDWLQRAANRRSDSLVLAGVEPGLAPLRDDPRFAAVLRRVGRPGR